MHPSSTASVTSGLDIGPTLSQSDCTRGVEVDLERSSADLRRMQTATGRLPVCFVASVSPRRGSHWHGARLVRADTCRSLRTSRADAGARPMIGVGRMRHSDVHLARDLLVDARGLGRSCGCCGVARARIQWWLRRSCRARSSCRGGDCRSARDALLVVGETVGRLGDPLGTGAETVPRVIHPIRSGDCRERRERSAEDCRSGPGRRRAAEAAGRETVGRAGWCAAARLGLVTQRGRRCTAGRRASRGRRPAHASAASVVECRARFVPARRGFTRSSRARV